MKNITKIAATALIAGTVMLGITACSGGGSTPSGSATSTSTSTPIPTATTALDPGILTKNVTELNGKTINMTQPNFGDAASMKDNVLIIEAATPDAWTGTIEPATAQATIAYFQKAGIKDGNPYPMSITAGKPGEAKIVLTNSKTGETVTFNVVVK